MTRRNISNQDKIIDSRDIIKRIDELENDLQAAHEDADNNLVAGNENKGLPFADWLSDVADDHDSPHQYDATELQILRSVAEEGEGSADWYHGETLIRDSYFTTYARELAEDCGMVKDADTWPVRCIDWDQAAEELQQDYMSVSFDGIDYWIRA